jgi:methionyl-tRNA synthetase
VQPLLVTAALPYANGPIHIGHLVEYVQADIWVRAWRMRGRDVMFLCADDTHGTPIMLRAQKEGIAIEDLLAAAWREHKADFAAFGVDFDCYYTTHSPENRELANEVFSALQRGGHIVEKEVRQPFCPVDNFYLPDRYIIGRCPHCNAEKQYGDACEVCSRTYAATELIEPQCAVCGAAPLFRDSVHLFFRVGDFERLLRAWMPPAVRPADIQNKLSEWFETGLADWDISRDAPYFGFEIPGYPGKYYYVWLDAPIGYMATTLRHCRETGRDFSMYWRESGAAEVVHFIGKDIAYFHGLFWPAMLAGAGFRVPTYLFIHGFLTIQGKKMSKSRGTFITAADYLAHLDPELLRYYFATKLSGGMDDIDFNIADFVARVNTDVVNKIVNLYSRASALLRRHAAVFVAPAGPSPFPTDALVRAVESDYEERDFAQAMRRLTAFADEVNAYFQEGQPWHSMQTPGAPGVEVCTVTLGAFRTIMTLLAPVMPRLACEAAAALGLERLEWSALGDPVAGIRVDREVRLQERIELETALRLVGSEEAS